MNFDTPITIALSKGRIFDQALPLLGAEYLREVEPGEVVRLDDQGMTSIFGAPPAERPALCIFEYIYFARPDSLLGGQSVHRVRRHLGERVDRARDAAAGCPKSSRYPRQTFPFRAAGTGSSVATRWPSP